jgi:hypothetical protein
MKHPTRILSFQSKQQLILEKKTCFYFRYNPMFALGKYDSLNIPMRIRELHFTVDKHVYNYFRLIFSINCNTTVTIILIRLKIIRQKKMQIQSNARPSSRCHYIINYNIVILEYHRLKFETSSMIVPRLV